MLPQKAFDRQVGVGMRGLYVDVESVHFFSSSFFENFPQVFNGLFSLSLCFSLTSLFSPVSPYCGLQGLGPKGGILS